MFGTRVEVVTWGEEEARARQAVAEVLREFDRIHRQYHAWQPSELTALNQAISQGQRHTVSTELAAMLREAQQFTAQGRWQGIPLFDPGIGQLIALWGFQAEEFKPVRPDPQAIQAIVQQHPSVLNLHIEDTTVWSDNRAVQLDLGGYGKGWALDRAAGILRQHGIHNALINIGGNVMALGQKGQEPWRVGIQHPRKPEPLATLPLYDGEAIGTSGDYQRYFELDGRRYSHLIDPRSGEPAQGTEAVTVLIEKQARSGTLSDAYSKPVFLAGEQWLRMSQQLQLPYVLRVDSEGNISVTQALRARLKPGADSKAFDGMTIVHGNQ